MPDVSAEPQPTSNQKSINWKKISLLLIVVLFLIGLVGVGIYLLTPQPIEEPTPLTQPQKQSTPSAKPATPSAQNGDTGNWKTFVGTASDIITGGDEVSINVSFKHPKEYEESRLEEHTIINTKPFRLSGLEEPGELQVLLALHTTEASEKLIADGYNGETTNTTLGGKTAKRYTHSTTIEDVTHNIVNYVVNDIGKNSWALEFNCLYFPKAGEELEKTCDLMASTFKFLD